MMLVDQGALVILAYVTCVTAKLELVHVIFRHGQRTPADTYPTDPYIAETFEPVGWGQLTNQGKLDQFNQGRFLRERYDEFLGDTYSPNIMAVQSTDVDRTIMSAQLEAAGLWPPKGDQKWRSCLNWQPIPVHAQPLKLDDLLLVRIPCLRYYEELDRVMASAPVVALLAGMGAPALYAQLTALTGMPIASPDDVQSLFSTLIAEESFGLTLPSWTQAYYPELLEPLTALSFELNTYNRELQKLKGGPLLKKILADSKAKAAGTLTPSGREMFMYAGHDSTIVNLLRALQVWDTQVPGYGIMIIIELHSHDGASGGGPYDNYEMKFFLRNSTEHKPYRLTLPGCSKTCPLNTVIGLTADVIPANLVTECVPLDPNYTHGGAGGP